MGTGGFRRLQDLAPDWWIDITQPLEPGKAGSTEPDRKPGKGNLQCCIAAYYMVCFFCNPPNQSRPHAAWHPTAQMKLPYPLKLLIPGLLLLCSQTAVASERADLALSDLQMRFDAAPAWQAPAIYSARVMSLGIAGLVAFDLHDSDPTYDNFLNALRDPAPREDDDGALFNLVLHPLWGSETYLRARQADLGVAGSFAFSMGASTVWEYFIESWTEHPSTQDLINTTGIGWIIGEMRYQALRALGERRGAWIDPLYNALEYVQVNVGTYSTGYGMEDAPMVTLGWHI